MSEVITSVVVALAIVLVFAGFLFISLHLQSRNRPDLGSLAQELGFSFHPIGDPFISPEFPKFRLFERLMMLNVRDLFRMKFDHTTVLLYLTGGGSDGRTVVVCLFNENWNIPEVELSPEGRILRSISQRFGQSNVTFSGYPQFLEHYRVRGKDSLAIRDLVSPAARSFLATHPGWYIKGKAQGMLMYKVKYYSLPREDADFIRTSWQEILPLCRLFQQAAESAPVLKL